MGFMKNYIIAFLVLITLGALYFAYTKKPEIRNVPEYIEGKTDTVFIPKLVQRTIFVRPEVNRDTNQNITNIAIDTIVYDEEVIITAFSKDIVNEPLRIDYYNLCKERNIIRIDTIKTLKFVEVEKPQPFYNSFWFGSAVTAVAGGVALILLK